MMPRHFLITGCSGAGKSSLLDELANRGCSVVREPGRRLVARGIEPWTDIDRFLNEAEALGWSDLADAAAINGPVFFDRGVLDAVAGIERIGGMPMEVRLGGARPYSRCILFAGAWPEIFANDAGRPHSLAQANEEEAHLRARLPELGYILTELPRGSTAERADFTLAWAERASRR